MSADIIQAKYDELDTIASRLKSRAEANAELYSRIENCFQALQKDWEGKGANAFFAEMKGKMFPAMQRLTEALDEARSVTLEVKNILQEAEEEAASVFDSEGPVTRSPEALQKQYKEHFLDIKRMEPIAGEPFIAGPGDNDKDIHPSDADQNQLRDCYLVSSLASLAAQNREVIRRAIKPNRDGTYTVTFYRKEEKFMGLFGGGYEKVQVTVRPTFPVLADGSRPYIIEDQDTNKRGRELWPALMEKAYAKFIGGNNDLRAYNELNHQDGTVHKALQALTGVDSETRRPEHYSINELARMEREGHAIVLSSFEDGSKKDRYKNGELVAEHAYYVTDVNTETGKVTIRNPWGWNHKPIKIPYNELNDYFAKITVNPTR
jgi:WXG100 family type VII secretion target